MPEESKTESSSSERPHRTGTGSAALFGFAVLFVATAAAFTLRTPAKQQPVAFNHQLHVVENGMDCSDCHEFYKTEAFSGLPTAETCSLCHVDAAAEASAEEKKLVQLLQDGKPLTWTPLFRQPPHIFYSHRRHVEAAKLDCAVCHGQIAESTAPPRWVHRLTMEECIGCHERQNARTDCTTCHR